MPDRFGDARTGEVGLAAHDGGDGAGVVAALVAIVGHAHRHQQRAQVGEAQAQRAEGVRVLADLLGGIAGVIDDDFLRQDHRIHGVAEGFDIELAVRARRTSSGSATRGCRPNRRGTCTPSRGSTR